MLLCFGQPFLQFKGLEVPVGGMLVGFIAGGFSIAATNGGIGSYPLAVMGAFLLFNVPESPSEAFGWIMLVCTNINDCCFWGIGFLSLTALQQEKIISRVAFGM